MFPDRGESAKSRELLKIKQLKKRAYQIFSAEDGHG
jgi:hypothetical protein